MLNLADEILFRAPHGYQVQPAQESLRRMASVLGLLLDQERPQEELISAWNRHKERFEGEG